MAQAVITLGYMCVEGGLQARCLNGFYSSWFIIYQSFDWRPYFISPAFEKYLSSPAGTVSYMTTKISLLRLSAFKSVRVLVRVLVYKDW